MNCLIDGCDRPQNARGLCPVHYGRIMRRGLLDRYPPTAQPAPPPLWFCECAVPDYDGIECRACHRKPAAEMAVR